MEYRVKDSPHEKYERLKHILRSMKKIAVAFSGGVDSSLLLYAALEVRGDEAVYALHARSVLTATDSEIVEFHAKNFRDHKNLIIFHVDPLSWPEFIEQSGKRCYFCKKRTYAEFLTFTKKLDECELIDGTNRDDLQEFRPGLDAVSEYSVKTPLIEAGLGKKEIRFLAQLFGLENYNTPSNSCLATRLFNTEKIEKSNLTAIKEIEKKLKKIGFIGCRAKIQGSDIVIELRNQDFNNFSQRHNRIAVIRVCRKYGFEKVLLDIAGRAGG